jgi:hypothetical protein
MAQNKEKRKSVMKAVINFRIPYNFGKFLSRLGNGGPWN